jgi:acetolactate synthase-1/2/3 large subunit
MKNAPDGGDAVLQAFRSLGIDYVMSSPGSEWGSVWEALAQQQVANEPGPTYLSCAHETLAVDMAIGYTQVTGRMQAVMLHAGVGLLQGALGIEGALRGGIPMIVLSGESTSFGDDPDVNPGFQWQALLNQVGGPQRLLEPLTKWSSQTGSTATLYNQIVSAGELAQRNPRAPVYLTVPIEVMRRPWTPPESLRDAPPAPVLTATPGDIAAVAEMLVAAECPAVITEEAGRDPAGNAALVALAEMLGMPVTEGLFTFNANFPTDHPLYLGPGRHAVIDEADLILTVGTRQPWYPLTNTPRRARIVAIDDQPFKDHQVYQPNEAERFLEGDMTANMTLLAEAVAAAGVDAGKVAARRERWAAESAARNAETREIEAEQAGRATISPALLAAALRDAAPDDMILVDETITTRPAILRHCRSGRPQSYFRVHGGLGQAMGVAIGVKLAAPDRTVVATMGDGTFLYNPAVQALAFAAENGVPTLTVILNNRGYNAMKKDQQGYYPDGVAARNDLWLGYTINEFDYAKLAEPFGAFGATVDTPGDLPRVLADAFAAVAEGRPAIVNAAVD